MIPGWSTVAGVAARIVDTLWPSKKEALYDKLKSLEAKYAETLKKGNDSEAAQYKKQMDDLQKGAEQQAQAIANSTGKPVTIKWVFYRSGFEAAVLKWCVFPAMPADEVINPNK